ncbi:MAG: LLM class F420-dependent oxidoreductase [Candidatus Promineifilaceae bacterium]
MQTGVVFPQTEMPIDWTAVAHYTKTVEELGYTHVLAYDHVLGANPDRPGGWRGPYTYRDSFLEPFVLFSFMAGLSDKMRFASGVFILPQRETALFAKQAATLDVLSSGRLRLGIGSGWNEVEYVALNQDFHTRGKRQEEQVELLRRLWTEPLVSFEGRWHTIPDAGLNPLPVQRPIPLWFGGGADVLLRRVARLGDGWMPNIRRAADAAPLFEKLDQYLADYGRSRADLGIEPRLHWRGDLDALLHEREAWRKVGATHISLSTMGAGFTSLDEHLDALRRFAEAI